MINMSSNRMLSVLLSLAMGCIQLSHSSKCGNMVYTRWSYRELLDFDHEKYLASYSVCLSHCAINQSCAAVSYNGETSTCFSSGKPSVVGRSQDRTGLALVKESISADLKVYTFSRLLTQGAEMSLSSYHYNADGETQHTGEKAVDGIYRPLDSHDSETYSVVITGEDISPWIQADIHTNHYIFGVEIWDRSQVGPGRADRLANVRVTVGESDANFDDPPEDEICNYLPGQPPADQFLVTCYSRMYGRYVRITAVEINDKLNIYEMEIHGLELTD